MNAADERRTPTHRRFAYALLIGLLVIARPLWAQDVTTGPVTTSQKVAWQMTSSVDTAAAAQALEYRLRDNGGAFLAIVGVTCTGTSVPFNCQANLSAPIVSLLNVAGIHNVTLSAYAQSAGLESAQSVPFVLRSPAAVPMGVRITQ